MIDRTTSVDNVYWQLEDSLAQIRLNHAPATIGTSIFSVMPRWRVNTRSNSGAVTTLATIPLSRRVAPKSPETTLSYPAGSCVNAAFRIFGTEKKNSQSTALRGC